MNMLRKIRQAFAARLSPVGPPVRVSSNGFSVSGRVVAWIDIREITACKIDLLTIDEVRFSFSIASGQNVTVSEEQEGFDELMNRLVAAFPSVAGWQSKVISGPFAGNEAVLYLRS